MSMQTIPGRGMLVPAPQWLIAGNLPAFNVSAIIDATGEKAGMCGRVWNKDRSSKTINKVHFRFGTVVKAGGSALTVSLQDLSTSAAFIAPDETTDQYRAIANADANFLSNTWYTTGLLTSDGTDSGTKRTVAYGEALAIVVEYDGGGRLGSDSFIINGTAAVTQSHLSQLVLKTGGSWSQASSIPNVILEFSDGTFGTLLMGYPATAFSSVTYNLDTLVADEYALEFSLPFACKVDGCWFVSTLANAAVDFDLIIYNGTTPVTNGSVSVDGAQNASSGSVRYGEAPFAAEASLAANTTYRLAMKPTTANSLALSYFDVNAAGHLDAHDLGSACHMASRLDSGAWDSTGTSSIYLKRRPLMGIRISSLDDGVSAGLLVHPGMSGGMRG
jgi:hypothetical protein